MAGRGELALDPARAWCRRDADGWLLAIRVQPNASVSVVRGPASRSKTVRIALVTGQ